MMRKPTAILVLLLSIVWNYSSYGQGQNNCDFPVLRGFDIVGDLCVGNEITITLDADLNDASQWNWFIGQCENPPAASAADNSFTFTLVGDMVIYIKADGGCTRGDAPCIPINISPLNSDPVISCPEDIIVELEEGECETEVNYPIPTATDDCGEPQITWFSGPRIGDIVGVGSYEVVYLASDNSGNISRCSFNIEVNDTEAPTITCTDNIIAENDPGVCGAIINYSIPEAVDNCSDVNLTRIQDLESGSVFPVGTTTVEYEATDLSGNRSTCSFLVTVNDTEAPIITINDKKTRPWPPNHKHFEVNISDYISSVEDNCGGVSISDVFIESASSDEPENDTGDGNTVNDITLNEDCSSLILLAERQGTGNGRVYTVNLALEDLHGNIGRNSFTIEINHDQGINTVTIDDGPQYIVEGCSVDGEIKTNSNSESRISINSYPNPFTNYIEVNYVPEYSEEVDVSIYSLEGSKIATIFEGKVQSGSSYKWTKGADQLQNPIYLLVVEGDLTYQAIKILKQK